MPTGPGHKGNNTPTPNLTSIREILSARELISKKLAKDIKCFQSGQWPHKDRPKVYFVRTYGFEPELENIAVASIVRPPVLAQGPKTENPAMALILKQALSPSSDLHKEFKELYQFGTDVLGSQGRISAMPTRAEVTRNVCSALLNDDAFQFIFRFAKKEPIWLERLMDSETEFNKMPHWLHSLTEDLTLGVNGPSPWNIYKAAARMAMLSKSFDPGNPTLDPVSRVIFEGIRGSSRFPSKVTIAVFKNGSENAMRHLCFKNIQERRLSFLLTEFSCELRTAIEAKCGFMAASAIPGKEKLAIIAFGNIDLRACVDAAVIESVSKLKTALSASDKGSQLDRLTIEYLLPYFLDPHYESRTFDMATLEKASPHMKGGDPSEDVSFDPAPIARLVSNAISSCREAITGHRHKGKLDDPSSLLKDLMDRSEGQYLFNKELISHAISSCNGRCNRREVLLYAQPYFQVKGKESDALRAAAREKGEWGFLSEHGRVPFEALSLSHGQEQMDEMRYNLISSFEGNIGLVNSDSVFTRSGFFVLYQDLDTLDRSLATVSSKLDSLGYRGLELSLVISKFRSINPDSWRSHMTLISNATEVALLAPRAFKVWGWMDKERRRIMEVTRIGSDFTETSSCANSLALKAARLSAYALRERAQGNSAICRTGHMPGPIKDPATLHILERIKLVYRFDPVSVLAAIPSNHDPLETMALIKETIRQKSLSVVGDEQDAELEARLKRLEEFLIDEAKKKML